MDNRLEWAFCVGIGIVGVWLIIIGFVLEARAHPVHTIDGEELNITYPGSCCNSAATSPTGDCAPIDDQYVTERADGYHINLPVGAHPKLKTKGYSVVIPYKDARAKKQPLSNEYHLCVGTDGVALYCFFPKPGAV